MEHPTLTPREMAFAIAPALRAMLADADGLMGTVTYQPELPGRADIAIAGDTAEGILEKLQPAIDAFRSAEGRDPATFRIEGVGAFAAKTASRKHRRLQGRIALITGSAQGFGKGIADLMAKEGAYVVYADRNRRGAELASEEINALCGEDASIAVTVDVGEEQDIASLMETVVLHYGGLDVLISNAGIARAGSLDEMTAELFERITRVNYTAYFLCAKYAQKIMRLQNRFNPKGYCDIIQINSKSGLEGSNKNFAYSGSKFGGIGLTQSLALELCPYRIKVNAICPGNYLDGPLWSDPENGLFLQYLKAGKVPGAKTVADVKKAYEAKVPMQRGCYPIDVARAIYYCIEQEYETGQAIPVTGGQTMLN